MNCLRCGYCCHILSVMIVSDPAIGISEGNIEHHSGGGIPCKHLKGNTPGEYECTVHNCHWYEDTPCYEFDQIGEGDCRIGRGVLSGEVSYIRRNSH